MIFLLEYDRENGQLVSKRTFSQSERLAAEGARLQLELDLHDRGVEREVVILEAEDEDALRLTHRRYFQSVSELLGGIRSTSN